MAAKRQAAMTPRTFYEERVEVEDDEEGPGPERGASRAHEAQDVVGRGRRRRFSRIRMNITNAWKNPRAFAH